MKCCKTPEQRLLTHLARGQRRLPGRGIFRLRPEGHIGGVGRKDSSGGRNEMCKTQG